MVRKVVHHFLHIIQGRKCSVPVANSFQAVVKHTQQLKAGERTGCLKLCCGLHLFLRHQCTIFLTLHLISARGDQP